MPETGPDTPSLVMGDSHGSRICWDPGPGTAEPKKQFLVSGRGWEKVFLGLWGQISLLSSGTCWKSSGKVRTRTVPAEHEVGVLYWPGGQGGLLGGVGA